MALFPKRQLAILISLLMAPVAAPAYEEVEDLVSIFITESHFVAAVDGQRNFSESIRSGETVQWKGAKGEVGAILTNEKFLAVSVSSGGWNTLDLKISEKQTLPEMLISAHLVLMLTDERIVVFGPHTGGFFQTRLPIRESVVASDAQGRVAAVVTTSHAYGFSAYRRGGSEFRFRRQETLVSLKTTYNKITMQTSDRLVSLGADDAVWREFEF